MDEVNRELQELADQVQQEMVEQAYMEYLDAMLHAFYEENFVDSEWDLV